MYHTETKATIDEEQGHSQYAAYSFGTIGRQWQKSIMGLLGLLLDKAWLVTGSEVIVVVFTCVNF